MGLYLAIFRDDSTDDELEGADLGSYDDFSEFRQAVASLLEGGHWGSRFPILMNHSDSDGQWSAAEARSLQAELLLIAKAFRSMPPRDSTSAWQSDVFELVGPPRSLHGSFIDVDGIPVVERLIQLAEVAVARTRPILFQ